jgi:DNA-directed RNA polymerase specialized sigma24 family protein
MSNSLLSDCLNFASSIAKRYYGCYKQVFVLYAVSLEDLIQEAKVEALKEYRKWEEKPTYNLKGYLSMAVGWKRMNQIRTRLIKKLYSARLIKGKDIDSILRQLRKFTPTDIQCLDIKNKYKEEDEILEQGDEEYPYEDDAEEELMTQDEVIVTNMSTLYYDMYYQNTWNKDLYNNLGDIDFTYFERYLTKRFHNKNYGKIFRMRLIEKKTIEEIADELDLFKQSVSVIYQKIVNAMTNYNKLVDKNEKQ